MLPEPQEFESIFVYWVASECRIVKVEFRAEEENALEIAYYIATLEGYELVCLAAVSR
jgi:hypothetical protein